MKIDLIQASKLAKEIGLSNEERIIYLDICNKYETKEFNAIIFPKYSNSKKPFDILGDMGLIEFIQVNKDAYWHTFDNQPTFFEFKIRPKLLNYFLLDYINICRLDNGAYIGRITKNTDDIIRNNLESILNAEHDYKYILNHPYKEQDIFNPEKQNK